MQESAFVEDGSFFAYYENSIVLNRNKRYNFIIGKWTGGTGMEKIIPLEICADIKIYDYKKKVKYDEKEAKGKWIYLSLA